MSKKLLRSLSAAAAALVMMVTVPVLNINVSADGEGEDGSSTPQTATNDGYTDLAGGDTYFVKALVMDKEANVPNVSFSYSIDDEITEIAAGTTTGGATTLQVKKGVVAKDGNNKITAPTVATSTFTTASVTFDSLQTAEQLSTSNVKDNSATPSVVPDEVNLAGYEFETGKQKYARDEVEVDLSGIKFNEPGIYRYKITENASPKAQGITYDATRASTDVAATEGDRIRYLDVYVYHDISDTNNKTLKIAGYVLHKDADAPSYTVTTTGEGESAVSTLTPTEPSTKSSGYVNEYSSHNLAISKTVEGNQGSRDEYFEFTVNISGATPGTIYDVDLSNAQATTTAGINGLASKTNPASITVSSEEATKGTATATFWLRHGQSIVIKGLADGTKYSITENDTTMNSEGYATEITGSGDTDAAPVANTREFADTTTGIKADTTVAYKNTRQGVIPTGILLTFTPYIIIGLIAAAGIILLVLRRHKKAE